MLKATLASLHPLAAEAGVRLRYQLQEDVLLMHGDRHRIERILSNQVHNAVKFTPVGRSVTVRLGQTETRTVRLVVDDEGPGLADADLPYLFDLNYQSAINGRTAGRRTGLGLGLAIARMLARAHGGELTAANRPGGGARFTLCVPVSTCFAAPSAFVERSAGE